MPKLPDVVQVMLKNREKVYAQHEFDRKQREHRELMALEKRRAEHPEEFFGWNDLKKEFDKLQTSKDRNGVSVPGKVMPDAGENISPVLMGLDGGKRERELKEQAEFLKKKNG